MLPFSIGVIVAAVVHSIIHWWGFLVIFPWVGFSISVGSYLIKTLPQEKKLLGRRIAMLMIMPLLLLFIPIVNNENLQLEGIILNILAGYFTKSFVHLAIAKLFGPLIWGRAFCGWACWTAAILEWLPIKEKGEVPSNLKRLRYLFFLLTVLLPILLIFFTNYDIRKDYLHKSELSWMILGNGLYYVVAIALAYWFKAKRSVCKIACPVSVVMEVPTRFRMLCRKPSGATCIQCNLCNKACPMDVDVMSCINAGKPVRSTECIHCNDCKISCPVGAIK